MDLNSGRPYALAWASAEFMNTVVCMATVGIPRFSSSMESCTLHDVHEPQAPVAVMTKSHLAASSSSIAGSALRE